MKNKATKQINQLKKPTDSNKILKQNQKYIPNRIACLTFLKNQVSKGSIKPASRPLWWYLCPSCGKDPKNSRFPKVSKTPHFFSKLLFEYSMWFFKFLAASIFFLYINFKFRKTKYLFDSQSDRTIKFSCCLNRKSTFTKTVVLR